MARPTLTWPRLGLLVAMLAGITLAVWLACSLVGDMGLPSELLVWRDAGWMAVWKARLLRLATAAVVGAALAVGGMALQGLLRNPLAEPYILGISSGAGIGVLMGLALPSILLRFTGQAHDIALLSTPALALVGALVTSATVYGIAQRRGRLNPYVLLLSGVIINAFNGAVMLVIYLLIPPETITNFTLWAMGGLSDLARPGLLAVCTAIVLGGWALLTVRGTALNTLGLGDDVAASGGVHVHRLRLEVFVVVSLMTAASVALAGPIGFLGLIVPHVARLIVGPDHRALSIYSGFGGAIFLMLADTLCRAADIWLRSGVIPVGIVTALAGGPFFIFLLRRRSVEAEA
jgi:iron complex transport system permease protein